MDIIEQLKRDEGVRLRPYRDTVGKLTIGVGRNLDDKGISLEESEALLDHDIAETVNALAARGYPSEPLSPRYWVLVNMAFNMGVPGLMEFRHMLKAYREGDYATAAKEMLNSVWATQVGDRATRLSRQIEIGEWV